MHASFSVEKIAETRVSLVPRIRVHVRTVEELSGIVNSPVLFDVFKHELRPEGKEDLSYFRAEHETRKHFYIETHLNLTYYPAVVTRSSVVIDWKRFQS